MATSVTLNNNSNNNNDLPPSATSTTIIPFVIPLQNKVEESLEKGNKSYYSWSKNLPSNSNSEVNYPEPKLLHKETVVVAPTRKNETLRIYTWVEDKQTLT
eukprot:TRINITY_DN270_c1_g6_i2.p1 TRINITY_DN270_c1_g6~~TRINITY_DN270_c1_g6_i2.p1  ORF type:complete len:101 (-),score=46.44 TRINITY_DN270_c1_g6_i2:429-731(-)